MVAMVAHQTGVPEGTVIVHDRNLLNAGLRSEGQRGRGKSIISFEDAANLLIAVAGSRNVKDSAKTVRDYAPLAASSPLVFDDNGEEVKRGDTFRDALAALLEAVPADAASYSNPDYGSVDVFLYGPVPAARIEWRVGDKADIIDYSGPERKRGEPSPPIADLQFIAKFTQVTIGHVGALVK
jgi:hypothetical protein